MLFQIIYFLSILTNNILFADTECPLVTSIEDRREDKSTLRLVQYNVEWLFIDYYAQMDCPGNGCTWKNTSEAQTHMDYVIQRLRYLSPDIINFCEVEGCDELNMLKNSLDSNYMPYLIKGTDTATGQNVGMLTRIDPTRSLYRTEMRFDYPISGSKCGYTGSPSSTGVSKHYITEFNWNKMKIAFISAHLIAIPTDPVKCAQREAQASILQKVVADYVNKSYEIILMGDFNDFDNETLDVNSDHPTSQVLDILKGLNGDDYELHNMAELIIQNERFSDWYDSDNNCNTQSGKDYSMIDHILVTDGIQNKVINAYIYHDYSVFCGKYDSDHYPVVLDLQM